MRISTFNINGGSVSDALKAIGSEDSIAKAVGQREGDFLALQEVTQGGAPQDCIQTAGKERKQIALCYSGVASPGPQHAEGSQSIAAEIEFGD